MIFSTELYKYENLFDLKHIPVNTSTVCTGSHSMVNLQLKRAFHLLIHLLKDSTIIITGQFLKYTRVLAS